MRAATPLKARFGIDIEVSVEPERAGTGGALWHARRASRSKVSFCSTADSWFDVNLLALAAELAAEPSAIAAIAVRELADASRYGTVAIERGRVAGFGVRPERPGPGLVNGGVYVCRRRSGRAARTMLLARSGGFSARWRETALLLGVRFDGYFIDIGVPDLMPARSMRCRAGSGGRPPFSTATGCSTTMTAMSEPARAFAGSTAPRRRSSGSTTPAFLSLS